MHEHSCFSCQAKLDTDAIFCNDCGALQTANVAAEKIAEKPPQTSANFTLCPKCSKRLDQNVKFCPACAYNFTTGNAVKQNIEETKPPELQKSYVSGTTAENQSDLPGFSPDLIFALKKRYLDGYRVANTITNFGAVVKVLGVSIGLIIGFLGVVIGGGLQNAARANSFGYADASGPAIALTVTFCVAGFLVAAVGWIIGVIVSANGQMLKANLDGAVNSSPFLAIRDKAAIMSLPRETDFNNHPGNQNFTSQHINYTTPPNIKAAMAYGLGFILGIFWIVVPVYLLATVPKDDYFVRFHSFQSIFLNTIPFVIGIFGMITALTPVIVISYALGLIVLVVEIYCLWKAYYNEEFKIPLIGDIASNLAYGSAYNRPAF